MSKRLLLIEQGGNGGVCHYTFELTNALADQGAEVGLFTATDYELEDKERTFTLYNKIKWCRNDLLKKLKLNKILNIVYYLLALFSLAGIILKNKYKIVHIQGMYFLPMNVLTVCVIKLLGCQFVFTPHNTFQRYNKKSFESLYLWLLKQAKKIVVHSAFDKERLSTHYLIDPGKVEVIPHGNYGFFKSNQSSLEAPKQRSIKKNILFFGYIRPDKGLEYLIEGFASFLKDAPDQSEYLLKIVGRPEGSFEKYEELIRKFGVDSNIDKVLEYIPFEKVEEYFQETDLIVLPYIEISQSGVLQLAMSFGKPLIVTNVGGLPEIIKDNLNGFVVPVKDSGAIAQKLILAFQSMDQLEEMGKKNLELSETEFSWTAISKSTLDMYNRIN